MTYKEGFNLLFLGEPVARTFKINMSGEDFRRVGESKMLPEISLNPFSDKKKEPFIGKFKGIGGKQLEIKIRKQLFNLNTQFKTVRFRGEIESEKENETTFKLIFTKTSEANVHLLSIAMIGLSFGYISFSFGQSMIFFTMGVTLMLCLSFALWLSVTSGMRGQIKFFKNHFFQGMQYEEIVENNAGILLKN